MVHGEWEIKLLRMEVNLVQVKVKKMKFGKYFFSTAFQKFLHCYVCAIIWGSLKCHGHGDFRKKHKVKQKMTAVGFSFVAFLHSNMFCCEKARTSQFASY